MCERETKDSLAIAKKRVRDLQTRWCGFAIGTEPDFLESEACSILDQLEPDVRLELERVPVAILHSHQILEQPEIASYEYSDGIRFIAIDYRFRNALIALNTTLLSQLIAEDRGHSDEATFAGNAEIILSQFARFNPSHVFTKQILMPPELGDSDQDLLRAWMDVQVLFLLGHEYSHFTCGHFGLDRQQPLEGAGGGCQTPTGTMPSYVTRSQAEELQADQLGAALATNALFRNSNLTDRGRAHSMVGLDLLFMILNMIDVLRHAKEAQADAHVLGNTHPHGSLRLAAWRRSFSHHLTGFAGEVAFRLGQMAARVLADHESGQVRFKEMDQFGLSRKELG